MNSRKRLKLAQLLVADDILMTKELILGRLACKEAQQAHSSSMKSCGVINGACQPLAMLMNVNAVHMLMHTMAARNS